MDSVWSPEIHMLLQQQIVFHLFIKHICQCTCLLEGVSAEPDGTYVSVYNIQQYMRLINMQQYMFFINMHRHLKVKHNFNLQGSEQIRHKVLSKSLCRHFRAKVHPNEPKIRILKTMAFRLIGL